MGCAPSPWPSPRSTVARKAHAIVKRFWRKLDDPRLARVRREQGQREEPHVAGKKRPKSVAQTEKKLSAKPKRPKKTSRGK